MSKRRMIVIGIALTLVVGVVGIGFAAAQDGQPFGFGRGMMGGQGMHDMGMGMGFGPMDGGLITIAAQQLDMTAADLVTELQGGKSIAQVAEEKGVDLQTIVDAAVAQHTTMVNAMVQTGQLTQEQADAMTALMTANLTAELSDTTGLGMGMGMGFGQDFDRGFGFGGAENSLITIAAEQLDMTAADLVTELQGGKTIAQVAEEKGVDLQTIVDAAVAQHTTQINAMVEAGRLTQEQADAFIAQLTTRLTSELSSNLPAGGFGPGMMGRDGGMGMGGRRGPGGMGGARGPMGRGMGGFFNQTQPDATPTEQPST